MFDRLTVCPVCSSTQLLALSDTYSHAALVRCRACSFVFTQRIPTADELTAHYGGYPRNTSLSPITLSRYNDLLEQLEPFRKNNRLLDIGCGDGHFLAAAKAKGWEVYGTEFTEEAVRICSAKGINMHQGDLQTYPQEINFDVLCSFEVIEHLNDAHPHVQQIFKLLRSGGVFYFTTPNFNALSRRLLKGNWRVIEYPEHLSYYTPRTITRLLTGDGFRKLRLATTGLSLQHKRTHQEAARTGSPRPSDTLRDTIEKRFYMRWAKAVVNALLNTTGSGDSLKGFFVKP